MTWAWLRRDVSRRLHTRGVWLAVGLFVYAVLAMPVLLAAPPPHIQHALTTWFGSAEPFTTFLYLWTDVAMNKLMALLAVGFAAGVLVEERDDGSLPLLQAAPVTLAQLFLVRATSAVVVLVGLYVAGAALATPWFVLRVPGFQPGVFLLSTLVHAGAVAFAVALAATLAVVTRRRTVATVAALLTVFTLVGGAFAGFYNPAWATLALLNPFTLGVSVVGHVDALRSDHVVGPLLALALYTTAVLAVGMRAAARWEAT